MGKHKYIKTPQKLWEMFEAYKKEVKDNPRIKVEYVGKEGVQVKTPIERPLSISGFLSWSAYKESTIDHYWKNTDNAYAEYRPIVLRIREEIRQEQIDGGMTGFYNSSLTARLNSLSDKQEIETTANVNIINIDPIEDATNDSTSKDSESSQKD